MTDSPDERCEGRRAFVLTAEEQRKLISLFLPSARWIRNAAQQFLTRRLVEMADDCVQDTFMAFAREAVSGRCRCLGNKRLAELAEEELLAYARKCGPYLMAIAMNQCRSYYRRLERQAVLDSQAGAPGDLSDHSDPINGAMQKENRQSIQAVLARLGEPLRTAVILRYYGHFKISEIAAIAKIPEGTVKTRLRRAHKRMRSMLCAQDMEELLPERHALASASQGG